MSMRHKMRGILASLVLLAGTLGGLFLPHPASAASLSTLRVTTTGNGIITMAPGEVKTITTTFQNTGATAWKNDGTGYISLYTYDPKYRKSSFDPGNWLSASQVKRIKEATVAPGGVATIVFDLHAPSTTGTYKETFALASEGTAWIAGGTFALSIIVATPTAALIAPATTTTTSSATDGYAASLAVTSANKVKAQAGKTISFTAGFTNTGTKTWMKYGLIAPDYNIASSASISFANGTWSGNKLAYVDSAKIAPGQMAIVSFAFTAPLTNGTHTAKFQLSADNVDVPSAYVEIPVEVTGGAAEVIDNPENENAVAPEAAQLIGEPVIRVGILTVDEETDDEVVVTSSESSFELRDLKGNLLGEIAKGGQVKAWYTGGYYYFDRGQGAEKSASALRFIPTVDNAVMTIANFDRRVTRGSAYADNTFRDILEIRYSEETENIWMINELPFEMYLRGLAETSNDSHTEFQKALITAARTYGYYHYTHATKHDGEYYHVDAYNDQVYKGYGQELRTPTLAVAIDATRGQIVTYDGQLAITAYFSRSDGRTRDWSEVWGGSVPWSKSVSVPCDAGKTLWGHGVGMSASGALCMANEGHKYDSILKHFYTGIALTTFWK